MNRSILVLALLAGCASNRPVASPRSEGGSADSTIKAQGLVISATEDIDAVVVLAPQAEKLKAAKAKLLQASLELIHTRDVIKWWEHEWSDQHDTITRQEEKLAAYHRQWIGDRTWHLWYWIVGIWLGLGLVSLLLGGFFCSGPIAFISSTVLRMLPFANLFIRGRDMIRARGQTVEVTRDSLGSLVNVQKKAA